MGSAQRNRGPLCGVSHPGCRDPHPPRCARHPLPPCGRGGTIALAMVGEGLRHATRYRCRRPRGGRSDGRWRSTSATPTLPPGMQIRSSVGQEPKGHVGTRLRPQSLGTGAVDLATMCVAASGNRARTCSGPVKSSCVSCGKMTNPMLKTDTLSSIQSDASTAILSAMRQWVNSRRSYTCPSTADDQAPGLGMLGEPRSARDSVRWLER